MTSRVRGRGRLATAAGIVALCATATLSGCTSTPGPLVTATGTPENPSLGEATFTIGKTEVSLVVTTCTQSGSVLQLSGRGMSDSSSTLSAIIDVGRRAPNLFLYVAGPNGSGVQYIATAGTAHAGVSFTKSGKEMFGKGSFAAHQLPEDKPTGGSTAKPVSPSTTDTVVQGSYEIRCGLVTTAAAPTPDATVQPTKP